MNICILDSSCRTICGFCHCMCCVPGLFSLSSVFAWGDSVSPFSEDFSVSLQGSAVDYKQGIQFNAVQTSRGNQNLQPEVQTPLTLRWGLTRRQLCLFQSRLFRVGRWFCFCGRWLGSVPLISRFLLWAGLALLTVSCLLRYRCRLRTGGLPWRNNRQGSRRRKKKVDRGQRDELKGVQVWQKRLLRMARWVRLKCDEPRGDGQENKGEPNGSDGWWQNKRTHFLLCQFLVILLCGLLVLSGAQERLSLLYKSENNNNNSKTFFFASKHELHLSVGGQKQNLSRPGGTGVPGCVATGLAGTGVLGSEDKLSVSFFSSMPIGIRSGELSFPFTCSNSCTYGKKNQRVVQLQ